MEYERKAAISNFLPEFSAYGFYFYTTNTLDYDFAGTGLPIYKNIFGNLVPDLMKDAGGHIIYHDGAPVFNHYAMIPPVGLSFDLANTVTAGLMVKQPVFMGGKIITGYQMATIGRDMTRLNTQLKRSEVIRSVDEAYWLYVKTCKLLEAAESFVKTASETENLVKNAVDVGMANSQDLLKVRVQMNNAALLRARAKNGKTLSRMHLCHVMGIPVDTDLEVDGTDFGLDDGLFDAAARAGEDSITRRYDYRLLKKNAELRRKEIAFKRSDFLPQIGLMAGYGYVHGLQFCGEPLANSGGFSALVSLKIPIFAWGKGYLKLQSAKKDYEIAVNELERIGEEMQLEKVRNEYAVTEAVLQVDMSKTALEDAENNLRIAKDRYALGMETLVYVLEAQTQWNRSNCDYIEAVANYKLACTEYLKSVGELL